jgi:hypothetical protein
MCAAYLYSSFNSTEEAHENDPPDDCSRLFLLPSVLRRPQPNGNDGLTPVRRLEEDPSEQGIQMPPTSNWRMTQKRATRFIRKMNSKVTTATSRKANAVAGDDHGQPLYFSDQELIHVYAAGFSGTKCIWKQFHRGTVPASRCRMGRQFLVRSRSTPATRLRHHPEAVIVEIQCRGEVRQLHRQMERSSRPQSKRNERLCQSPRFQR